MLDVDIREFQDFITEEEFNAAWNEKIKYYGKVH